MHCNCECTFQGIYVFIVCLQDDAAALGVWVHGAEDHRFGRAADSAVFPTQRVSNHRNTEACSEKDLVWWEKRRDGSNQFLNR